MLRLVKWAYDLGVRHERVRIAAHLRVESVAAGSSRGALDDIFREEMSKPKPNKKRVERLEFDRAVNARVETIIEEMFRGNEQWVAGPSFLFPDDDHKGPVK